MKDSPTPLPKVFRMNWVEVGMDEDGVPELSSYLTTESDDASPPLKTYSKTTFAILVWFRENPGLETGPKVVAEVLKVEADNVGKSLKDLVEDGLLEKVSRGTYRLVRKVTNDPENSESSEA